jgi:myo-inositol-1(or 4)-monophosphatase
MNDEIMRRMSAGLLAVRGQAPYMHEQFGRAASKWKYDGTRVTSADIEISANLLKELSKKFPFDQFFSEETDASSKPVLLREGYSWLLDPVDGTNNFALGVPCCAISLALLENGVPVCGFIYDLGLRTLFHGGPGIGVFADGSPIERVDEDTGEKKIIAMHSPIDERYRPIISEVLENYKVRAFGSGALHLTYVALGRVDACLDFTVKAWDIAAALALCRHTGVDAHFFDSPVFPLVEFNVKMDPVRFVAAPAAACRDLVSKFESIGIPAR